MASKSAKKKSAKSKRASTKGAKSTSVKSKGAKSTTTRSKGAKKTRAAASKGARKKAKASAKASSSGSAVPVGDLGGVAVAAEADAAIAVDTSKDVDPPVVIDISDDAEVPVAVDTSDDADVPIVIDISDDDLGEEARERLLAEAVAAAVADEEPPGRTIDPPDGEPQREPAEDGTSSPERPLIHGEALVVLSEIHHEGLASLEADVVLDLGDTTSERERELIVQSALAHAEMQEAVYRVSSEDPATHRWKAALAAAILVVAMVTAVSPPPFLVPNPPATVQEADRVWGLRTALLLQAQQVEAHRVREQRLPDALSEVQTVLPGVRYVRTSDRLFQLVLYGPDGEPIVYDSAAPAPEFEALQAAWPMEGGPS